MLHLLFARSSCTHNRLFDFPWCVLDHIGTVSKGRAQCRGSRLAEFQGTAGILVHEHTLYGDNVGAVFIDNRSNRFEDLP